MRTPRAVVSLVVVASLPLLGAMVLWALGDAAWASPPVGASLVTWALADPVDAVVAAARIGGLVVCGWSALTTWLYVAAKVAGSGRMARRVRGFTLPGVRRLVDGAVALSLTTGALGPLQLAGGTPAAVAAPADAGSAAAPATPSRPPPGVVPPWDAEEGAAASAPDPGDPSPTTAAATEERSAPAAPAEDDRGDADAPPSRGGSTALAPPRASPSAAESPANASGAPPPTPDQPPDRTSSPDGAATNAPATTRRTVTVRPGDHLWSLAAAELARAGARPVASLRDVEIDPYWRRVVAANARRLRSGSPDLIYPGETVVLPVVDPR